MKLSRFLKLLSVFAFPFLLLQASGCGRPSPSGDYQVVEKWDLGRTIVVSDTFKNNEAALRNLAEQLRRDFKNESNLYIAVYSDQGAAAMRKTVATFPEGSTGFHDENMLGAYFKNSRSGRHRFDGQPKGAASDEWFRVEF